MLNFVKVRDITKVCFFFRNIIFLAINMKGKSSLHDIYSSIQTMASYYRSIQHADDFCNSAVKTFHELKILSSLYLV